MKTTGNGELDRVLGYVRTRRQQRAKRFAVLRWVVKVDYYDTEEAARNALASVPVSRRAGLVDRETGETRTSKQNYRPVMDTLRRQEFTAPERFRRAGVIGTLKRQRRRRGAQ